MGRRRHVARAVTGGYRIGDYKARRRWGDLHELCPDELLDEPNGDRDHAEATALLENGRGQRR
ncbi:hypothetical protein E1258_12275 [Micromonospora sp. KC207]|nr:hypothetical protein E1258_12275 [Micromonospora sp. KC207]